MLDAFPPSGPPGISQRRVRKLTTGCAWQIPALTAALRCRGGPLAMAEFWAHMLATMHAAQNPVEAMAKPITTSRAYLNKLMRGY